MRFRIGGAIITVESCSGLQTHVKEIRMTAATSKWQDWASFALGLWLAVSPWVAGYHEHEAATANAAFLGLALALGAHFELSFDHVEAEWLNLAAGVWLSMAPFVLDFSSSRGTANSIAVGILVAALAASALSLDRELGKLLDRFWVTLRCHVHGHRAGGGEDRAR